MKNKELNKGEIIIYKTAKNEVDLKVRLEKETILLTQQQVGKLFDVQKAAISKHVNNIFKSAELDKKSTVSILETVQTEGKREIIRKIEYYNLDLVLSIGYRVNTKRATEFRVWASKILKQYLIKGYAINEKRILDAKEKFNQLQETIYFLQSKAKHQLLSGQEKEILNLLADYAKTLTLLDKYDKNKLTLSKKSKAGFVLNYNTGLNIVAEIKKILTAKKEANQIFGQETENKFKAIIGNLYQTFNKKELYQSLEEKAAHLLYFVIKDHPFVDGNKRIASFIFVYYLDKNDFLYKKSGERKINDSALIAIALLIATSNPKEMDNLIKIITNLLSI
jgi:death-on-curing family protein